MIARLRILLPFQFDMPATEEIVPFEHEIYGQKLRIFPPLATKVTYEALNDLYSETEPVKAKDLLVPLKLSNENILINGDASCGCSLLQIDFLKDSFERSDSIQTLDPDSEFINEIINWYINTLRAVTKGPHIKNLTLDDCIWNILYLNDDASELIQQEGLVRGRGQVKITYKTCILDTKSWNKIKDYFPVIKILTWEQLILDASALEHDGPAIVLAFSALETLIFQALDYFADESKISADIWAWVKAPGHDSRKKPSIAEQFDYVLKMVKGISLKDNQNLWNSFTRLKKARNSFVHVGFLSIDNQLVDKDEARQLINGASQIIDWVESFLPQEMKRCAKTDSSISIKKPIMGA